MLFRKAKAPQPVPLYMALVGWARQPWFYTEAAVPDSLDGRFDMMALMISLALLRLERDGEAHRAFGQALLETFITDMDETMREAGAGDLGVGKHVKRMAEAFVGRYGAYRAAEASGNWTQALERNLYRGAAVPPAMVRKVADVQARLAALDDEAVLAGHISTD
jgi:cytochrome b pre-mRNA-processing protein 3